MRPTQQKSWRTRMPIMKMVKNKSVDNTDFVKNIFTDLEVKAQNKAAILEILVFDCVHIMYF